MFKIFIKYVLFLLVFIPVDVFAHPGRTDSSGCHTCRTNCPSYGLSYGQYHCHGGSSNNKNNNKVNSSNKNEEDINKSSDTSIKELIIDGNIVSVSDSIRYETSSRKVDIVVILNDQKSSYTINKDLGNLDVRDNYINIKVVAEDGTIERYSLVIYCKPTFKDIVRSFGMLCVYLIIFSPFISMIFSVPDNKRNKRRK